MSTDIPSRAKLLDLCKLLLDEDRLRLLGLIAQHPLSHAELMERSALKGGVLARHLYQLQEASLISLQREGDVDKYALNGERIRYLKRQLFAAPPDAQPQSEEEEVLARFVQEGRLTHLPVQRAKLPVVLAWLAEQFHPGVEYPERAVNQILDQHVPDYATLRRLLVDHRFLARSGGIYRRVVETE